MRVPFKGLKNVPWQKDLICSVSLQRVEPDPRRETLRAAQIQLNIKNKHTNLFFFFFGQLLPFRDGLCCLWNCEESKQNRKKLIFRTLGINGIKNLFFLLTLWCKVCLLQRVQMCVWFPQAALLLPYFSYTFKTIYYFLMSIISFPN